MWTADLDIRGFSFTAEKGVEGICYDVLDENTEETTENKWRKSFR
jgi:hypothetical protein